MKTHKRSKLIDSFSHFSLIVAIILSFILSEQPIQRDASTNTPPVAEDDGGIITDEATAILTPNVLENDSDPDHDNLFVQSIDTSHTLGKISIPLIEGSLDTSFSDDGMTFQDFNGSGKLGNDISIQPDGKILIGGGGYGQFAMARYTPDGNLDPAFGEDGLVITAVEGTGWRSYTMVLQTDGKIIQGGPALVGYTLLRYNPDGSLDDSFGTAGKLVADIGNPYGRINAIAVQPDENILLTGQGKVYPGDFVLMRYYPNGTMDPNFNGGVPLTINFGGNDEANGIAIQPDNKIIVVGGTFWNFIVNFALARITPDGTLDYSFNGTGQAITDFGGEERANDVILQNNGKFIAAGSGGYGKIVLARYNPDGSLDPTFGEGGKVITNLNNDTAPTSGNAIAMQPDGKILFAGSFAEGVLLVRYNQDGTEDVTFGDEGRVLQYLSWPYPNEGRDVVIQQDAKIVVGGTLGDPNYTNPLMFLARFWGGGKFIYDPSYEFLGLGLGEEAVDTFNYVVSDGILTDTATVSITITGLATNFIPFLLR
ncbi:MAG TPA: hypothetical protein VLD65_01900 [Anaerolineales bacterium]|nr:hypothetical protein [Anaerolineales bacterium]